MNVREIIDNDLVVTFSKNKGVNNTAEFAIRISDFTQGPTGYHHEIRVRDCEWNQKYIRHCLRRMFESLMDRRMGALKMEKT